MKSPSSAESYKQLWHLQELRSVLEEVQKDLRFQPLPTCWVLKNFADLGEVFTEEDGEKMVEDCRSLGRTWLTLAVQSSRVCLGRRRSDTAVWKSKRGQGCTQRQSTHARKVPEDKSDLPDDVSIY